MASLSQPEPLDSITGGANALIIYTLSKDVEGSGDDRILYIMDSIRIKLTYPLLDFPPLWCFGLSP